MGDVYEDTEDDLRTLHIDGNGCVSCHRFSDPRSFSFGGGPTYEVNEHMPPSDPGSMAADFQALLDCADAGPEDTPECEWRQVPGAPEAECAQRTWNSCAATSRDGPNGRPADST